MVLWLSQTFFIRSKLPEEKWLFDEVLPSIREYGAYATPGTLDEILRNPKFAAALLRKVAEERRRVERCEDIACKMAPKAAYYNIVLQLRDAMPISLIAKDHGMIAAGWERSVKDTQAFSLTG